MYLSRVEIDTGNRTVLRTLNHLGAYHNWVEQAFPDEIRQETRSRKLWRIDQISGKRYLLVVSETEPDCEQMETYAVKGSFGCKDYEPFLKSIRQGESLRFRVTLNPVHSVFEENKNNRGKVYPIYAEEAQRKFLLDRTEKHGFYVESAQFLIVERREETLFRRGKKRVDLVKAVYEGVLTVENLELFVDLLCHGMGREKAYGFGMMTVIRG